jgi:hypothetical protein
MLRRSECAARKSETHRTSAFQVNKNYCVLSGEHGKLFCRDFFSVSHLAVSLAKVTLRDAQLQAVKVCQHLTAFFISRLPPPV